MKSSQFICDHYYFDLSILRGFRVLWECDWRDQGMIPSFLPQLIIGFLGTIYGRNLDLLFYVCSILNLPSSPWTQLTKGELFLTFSTTLSKDKVSCCFLSWAKEVSVPAPICLIRRHPCPPTTTVAEGVDIHGTSLINNSPSLGSARRLPCWTTAIHPLTQSPFILCSAILPCSYNQTTSWVRWSCRRVLTYSMRTQSVRLLTTPRSTQPTVCQA